MQKATPRTKCRGKVNITLIFMKDGKEIQRVQGQRHVYEDPQGQLWVIHPSGKKQVQQEGDQIIWYYPIPATQTNPIAEILSKLPRPA